MTFHSACARMLRADAERLGYTRGFTIYDEAGLAAPREDCVDELDVDPKRFAPRGIRRQISDAKNQLLDAEAYRLKVVDLLRADGRRRLRALRAAAPRGERDGLRRPAVPLREPLRAVPRGPRPLPPRLPPRARRRVPGHEPTPSTAGCSCCARSTATCAWSATTTSRSTRFRGADIRNILDFENDFPDAEVIKLEQNYRSTQTILAAVERGDRRTTASARTRRSGRDLGDGDPVHVRELEDEHAEARFVGRRDRAARGRGRARATRSRSSTAPTRRAACSRTCWCATASATR